MFKRFSGFLAIILVIATLGVSFTSYETPSAQAQSDEVLARIDDAMAHLSTYLGRTITRRSHFWQWSENVWNNQAMECGVPEVDYPNELTRGYRVRITVDDVEYDYRVKSDGSVLILCLDGLPDTSSIGIDTSGLGAAPGGTGGTTVGIQPLPTGTDWTWTYDHTSDMMYLFNPNGIQAQLPRPKLPNEAVLDGSYPVQLAVSRDGRYLVESSRLNNDRFGIGFYSFETGEFIEIHEAEANEEVKVGNFFTQSALISDVNSQRIAIGFATFNFEAGDPSSNSWRVIVFDLATGTAMHQLNSTDASVASVISSWGADYSWASEGFLFPIPFYYDPVNGGTVHFSLMMWFTEGIPNPPAFTWVPSTNTVATSPYFGISSFDINTLTGEAVWPRQDPAYAILPPVGPFTSYNTIAQGFPGSESNIWVDGTSWHFGAQVANGGDIVLFRTDDNVQSHWNALDIATNTSHGLIVEINQVRATPGGFWSMTDSILAFHTPATINVGSPVFNGSLSDWQFVWASTSNVNFALTEIAIPDTTPVGGGATFCPGAPSSIISSGMRARVTLSDTDPLPLRLRTAPAGEFVLSIAEGTEFTVIGGPQCADNFTWWQIRLDNGTTGWSAEGDTSKYFMEPAP